MPTPSTKTEFEREFPSVHQLAGVLERCLWALAYQKHVVRSESYLVPREIRQLLLKNDVTLAELSIARALARAGEKVDREDRKYRIMHAGEQFLRELTRGEGPTVFYVDGGSEWSQRRVLAAELLRSLANEVLIVDKYIGVDSLDLLGRMAKQKKIRFLTAVISGNELRFRRELERFRRERPKVELRRHRRPQELHDRYILSGDELYLLGHGLKDFGKKESFVAVLRGNVGAGIRCLVRKRFESRWAGGTPL